MRLVIQGNVHYLQTNGWVSIYSLLSSGKRMLSLSDIFDGLVMLLF